MTAHAPQAAPAAGRARITCVICGTRFDPAANSACGDCPLSGGCSVACCPACGFSNADPAQSRLVRALGRLRRRT